MKCNGGLKDVNGFHELATKQINYLRTQIDLINPNLVVLCLSKSAYLRELLFPDAVGQWKNSGYDVEVAILPDKNSWIFIIRPRGTRRPHHTVYCKIS